MNLNKCFSIGDRVKYVSPDEPEYDGLTGTIEEVDMTSSTGEEFAYVIFDNEIEDTVPLSKLKPIMKGINEMKKVNESGRMSDQDILDWIGQKVSRAEWCTDMTFDDHDAVIEVETQDGNRFEIIIKPMEGGSSEGGSRNILGILKKYVSSNKYCIDVTQSFDDRDEEFYFIDVDEDIDELEAQDIADEIKDIPQLKGCDITVDKFNGYVNGIVIFPS